MESNRTVGNRKQCVVAANADMVAGVKFGAALAYNDVAGNHGLAAKLFDAETPAAAVAAVAR